MVGEIRTLVLESLSKQSYPFSINTTVCEYSFKITTSFPVKYLPQISFLTLFQTTNSRLLQIPSGSRQQFQILQKCQKVLEMGRKRCGNREIAR